MTIQIVIVNHNVNRNAIELARGFAPHAPTVAIDSGSRLDPAEVPHFEIRLPNVHYSGLMNEAVLYVAGLNDDDVMYFICSDVSFADHAAATQRLEAVFRDPAVGAYAPSANASSHPSMLCHGSGGARPVCFVEGFCFASRIGLLRRMCPVDLEVNRIGWGLDVYLGYLALASGRRSVVDDEVCVHHPWPSGYAKDDARRQRDRWFRTLPRAARAFRLLAGTGFSHTTPGIRLITGLFGG
jgi:hypothetical protein